MLKPSGLNNLLVVFLLLLFQSAYGRSLPTPAGKSVFEIGLIKNYDEFDPHWGGNVGYCWRGRLDFRLDYRDDGFPGAERFSLQGEIALLKKRGFILESGYHHELSSKSSHNNPINVVPFRVSFPFKIGKRLFAVPNFTYWHILKRDYGAYGFAGLDFLFDERYAIGLELNVNQDFRYHNLDLRLGVYW